MRITRRNCIMAFARIVGPVGSHAAKLRELGLEIGTHEVIAGRRNIWGTLKGIGTGPTILMAGHLDTVGVDGYDNPFEPGAMIESGVWAV
jgi:hypothetical protein